MKDEELIRVVPSSRQLVLQEMEFYAFVHFTVNTFTDREWGDGSGESLRIRAVRAGRGSVGAGRSSAADD